MKKHRRWHLLKEIRILVASPPPRRRRMGEKGALSDEVINLIKDMQTQLQKEQEEDEEVYEKVQCR